MKAALSLFTVLVAMAMPLAAQNRDAEKDALFSKLDRNRDGYLSREELTAPAALEGNWIAVDRDGDGRISRAEFGIVRNFARAEPPGGAAGATQPEQKAPAKASGQP
jgi:Ca2+-binding EF-hand superfamily protein